MDHEAMRQDEQRKTKSEIAARVVAICVGDNLKGTPVCASFTPTEAGYYCKACGWAEGCHTDRRAIEALLDQFVEANKMVTDTSSESSTLAARASWQPIETAPKDGTAVLVYRPNSRERIAVCVVRDWCGPKCCPQAEPTHWQPLPQPPEGQATA